MSTLHWLCQHCTGYVNTALVMSTLHWLCQHCTGYVNTALVMSTLHWLCQHYTGYVNTALVMSNYKHRYLELNNINSCVQFPAAPPHQVGAGVACRTLWSSVVSYPCREKCVLFVWFRDSRVSRSEHKSS
ncbi:hypothetical protein J6590_005440 [Homalodisca vitripennis]|nr:hypothetical protein J6590_005440 [Homalodisca vitripennis]